MVTGHEQSFVGPRDSEQRAGCGTERALFSCLQLACLCDCDGHNHNRFRRGRRGHDSLSVTACLVLMKQAIHWWRPWFACLIISSKLRSYQPCYTLCHAGTPGYQRQHSSGRLIRSWWPFHIVFVSMTWHLIAKLLSKKAVRLWLAN